MSLNHPRLLSLPTELLSRTLEYLTDSPESMQSLLLTSKPLYSFALPYSVHTFRHTAPPQPSAVKSRSRILQFLRYILIEKPGLAVHVRNIVLRDFSVTYTEQQTFEELGPREDEQGVFKALVNELYPLGEGDDYEHSNQRRSRLWYSLYRGEEIDAEVCLLLTACWRLKELYVGGPLHMSTFHDFIRRCSSMKGQSFQGHPYPLSNLEVFYSECNDRVYGNDVYSGDISCLFYQLPRLRSYESIMSGGSDMFSQALCFVPSRSLPIKDITLRSANFSTDTLATFIGACRALRSFEFIFANFSVMGERAGPRSIVETMLQHAETLEYLHFNLSNGGWTLREQQKAVVGPELVHMKALKTLVAGMQDITGIIDARQQHGYRGSVIPGSHRLTNVIPPNLEHLEIVGCEEAILPQIKELLQAVNHGHFPKLQCVRLLFKAEYVKPHQVQPALGETTTNINVEIVFQTIGNRLFDFMPITHKLGEREEIHCCTRIYSPTIRNQWLKHRGGNKGRASVYGKIQEIPRD